MFEMKPEYYIGIDMIDQEHKQLFDYANEAYELLQEEFTPDKYDKKRTVCIIFVAACAAFDFFVCNDPWCGSVCKKYVGVECDFHFAVCF